MTTIKSSRSSADENHKKPLAIRLKTVKIVLFGIVTGINSLILQEIDDRNVIEGDRRYVRSQLTSQSL